ncbi:TPA: hypothetical protein ACJIWU_000371 [Enterobacter chengduensis]|uniref:Uncharacterized protein n=1 Tax=Enterobacter chuandaensis TaxID=2497875 RepID=A0AA96RSQ3_9ENTR|nr:MULTISPECIES: hypothetical protein [Enterobacteriaceae]EKS6745469.1 hypothetical protein [Enterobacter kobei]HCB0965914.1 hypothetical protein [Klebsiella quasipneumoniae subsp. similipneumoniae]HDK7242981.1 hypothetical protein [Cronobacter sakazakii]AXS03091.1 hypothetical protein D0876_08980 [Klebsiella pneumoniae]EHN8811039.1 hypothetical protein [Enterobacter hormaechei]
MEETINAPINYYDSERRLIIGANLIGKIHSQLFDKLNRRAGDGSKHTQQARITEYLEGLLTNV